MCILYVMNKLCVQSKQNLCINKAGKKWSNTDTERSKLIWICSYLKQGWYQHMVLTLEDYHLTLRMHKVACNLVFNLLSLKVMITVSILQANKKRNFFIAGNHRLFWLSISKNGLYNKYPDNINIIITIDIKIMIID